MLFTARSVFGLGVLCNSPAEFGEFILDYTKNWGKVIRDADIKAIER